MTECNHLPTRTVPAQREQLCAMRATLAHEHHQPVVLSGDEAMGAPKLPRCVYDRGCHSHVRLQVTTVAKFIIGNAAKGNRRAAYTDRKDEVKCAPVRAPLTVL